MGKGGGGGGPTQSTSYQTNVPEYARPYVETMLGATQKQLFTTQNTTDAEGNVTGTEITGFQPYKPYSTNPADAIAGFSPLQQQVQTGVAGLQTPGAYGAAQGIAGISGLGQLDTAGQAGMYGRQGAGLGMMGMAGAMPAFGAGQQYAQQATSPQAMQAYMSPYMQDVVDVQRQEAVRNAQMGNLAGNLASAKSGTYGGARQALAQAERERNLGTQLNAIQAQGLQNAFQQAQQAQQFGANLGLQGIQTGLQGVATGMQGIGQGLQGVGAQQAGYQGAGQAASTMGALAGQQFGTQKDILSLQNQIGAQQQQQQQQIINQAMQDYANQQQYPLMQLGFMSNMLRGLPMQATTTQQYQALANPVTQGIGMMGAGANIYNAFKASGGEVKSYAKGGIAGYSAGDRVKSNLYRMDKAALEEIAKNTTSDTIRDDAEQIAKLKQLGLAKAGGGIIAFADGKTVRGLTSEDYVIPDSEELKARREADIAAALALQADRKTADTDTTSSVMFDQMKGQAPTSSYKGIVLQRPEDFKVPVSASTEPPRKVQKGYQALLGIDPNAAAPSRSIIASGGPKDIDAEIAAEDSRGIIQAKKDEVKQKVADAANAEVVKDEVKKTTPAPAVVTEDKKDQAAPVAAKDNKSIKAATPATTTTGTKVPGLSPTMQYFYDKSQEKQQTLQEIMDEQQAIRDKYVGPDTRPQERAELMAEKANAQDEARRQRSLRAAAFFAKWGSTPGPTLIAGMDAFQKAVPGFIEDEKEARKVQNEINGIIRELNKAERLEKLGYVNEAIKIRTEQGRIAKDLNKSMLGYIAQTDAAKIRATGTDKIQQEKLLISAQKDLGSAKRSLTDLRSKNKALYDRAAMPGEGPKIDEIRNKAKAEIDKLEAPHIAQIQEAKNTLTALRKHGDIVIPTDKEIESAELGTAANPIKLTKPAKG